VTVVAAPDRAQHRLDMVGRRVLDIVRAHPEIITAILCGIVLAVGQRGPDLPAQAYRVFMFRRHGLVAFDSHWYAGHPLPGYSLVFPPLAALLGARLVGALSCVAATAAFSRLLRGSRRTGHDLAIVWFAVVSVVNLIVGRLPFALGLAAGIGALTAARDGRRIVALLLAIVCGCASPLAGAFLLLAAVAWWPSTTWRSVWPLGGAGVGIVAAAAFGEGGWFPFPVGTLVVVMVCSVGGYVVVPRSSRSVRRGFLLYGLVSLALFAFHNPVGGNMVRLGACVAGPVVAYELMKANRKLVLAIVAGPVLFWQFAPVPTAFAAGHGNPSAHAEYYTGILRYITAHGASTSRLEVPLTEGRWEADYLATKVSLARGWERQLDLGRNDVLYDEELSAAAYHQWLLDNGVRWVALPDVPLDASEDGEKALLDATPPPYLRPVWHDLHWQLWEVRDARPLLSGPARLDRLGASTIRLTATGAGTSVLLVKWTRFWRVTQGEACIAPTDDGWTQIELSRPGPVRLTAKIGFGALTGAGRNGSCSDSSSG
jgi:hypothetical protein